MKRIVFLSSGNGGNLEFLRRYLQHTQQDEITLCGVVATPESGAAKLAAHRKIPLTEISNPPLNLTSLLASFRPDLVISTYDRIIDKACVKEYENRIINLHYSLLPSFPGICGRRTVEKSINAGCKITGCTVHFVTEDVDTGEIIAQAATIALPKTEATLQMNIIFRSGCLLLLSTITKLLKCPTSKNHPPSSVAKIKGVPVLFSPAVPLDLRLFDEEFWNAVALGARSSK